MYFLTTVLPLWKIPPVKTRKPPETSSTFLQMLPSPEASLRLTVSERSDRFALLTAQKVKRSWQLERLPVWPRGHLYPPSCYSCRWMRVPFCSLCIPHTCWALESKWSWIWPSTLRSAAEQWAFLNKQHGAEKSFTFLSLSVSGAATCVRLLCDYRENCWPRYWAVLCVSTKKPVQKNSFVNSLFSPFVSLSPVVFRSFVALWVVDRWTWAFLVYINVIFLFRRMNIQLKPAKIGLHLHWLCCRPGFLPPRLVFDLNLRPRWTRWILPSIMLMRYQHPVVACT